MHFKKAVFFLYLLAGLSAAAQQTPQLVIPKGFFMVSAGLNSKGDIVTLSASNKLMIWNLDSLKQRVSVDFNTKESYNAHFSQDDKYIIISHTEGTTTVVDAATGATRYIVDGWIQDILKKEISADGKNLITIPFTGKKANVWNLATGKLIQELKGHDQEVSFAIFNNKSDRIVTCDRRGALKFWEPGNPNPLITVKANEDDIFYSCFSADDKYLATASYDGTSAIIETATGKIISRLKGHTALITDLQFNSTNKIIISASSDKTAAVWNLADGKKLITIKGHSDEVLTCRFADDEESILTSSKDGTIKKWTTTTGKLINSIRFAGDYGTYSIYNSKLILCNKDRINIYTYPELKLQYSLLQLDSGNHLAFDPKGRYDGTEAARKLLYFTCGKEIIELDQIKDQLWVPGLAERMNKGETIFAKTLDELNICDLTPETVTVPEANGNYHFKITPRRGGLGETVLLVNGIPVGRYKKEELKKNGNFYDLYIDKKELDNYFTSDAKNRVVIKSYTADNSFSSRGAIGTSSEPSKKSGVLPTLYAVMVGVSDYKGQDLDLRYAAKDATDISKALKGVAGKLLNTDGKEHVFVYNLTTAADRYQLPEKNAIKNIFIEIGKKATANDILVVFFAGHGILNEKDKQFYFLTADASSLSSGSETGISTKELAEWMKPQNLKAQKRILILDACNSGQIIKDFVKLGDEKQGFMAARNDEKAKQIKAIDKLNEQSGLFILAASASDQSAYESGMFSQGLLTYSLLKAIKEQPDILQDGKYLDVSRWFNAAEKTVSDMTRENAARQQPQVVSNTNFNIGLVDEEVMSRIILPKAKPVFTNSNIQNRAEEIAMDDLGLNRLVDARLIDLAANGAGSMIQFIAGYKSDEVYGLSGRYEVKDNLIIARMNIRQGNLLKQKFEISGSKDKLELLADKISKEALEMIKEK